VVDCEHLYNRYEEEPMTHSPAVIEKAQKVERLLLRLETGEPFDQVRADLGLNIEAESIPKLQAKYEVEGRSWEALIDGRHGHPRKAHSAMREWMYERKREDEFLTAGELADEIEEQFQVRLSIGHINYLLRKVELTGPRGHPYRRRKETEAAPSAEPKADESLDNAGVFFPRGSETGDGDHPRR
jgi:transposase